MTVVKRSVAIHPAIDECVRIAWATLIESGYNVTYSTALNSMLLIAILEISEMSEQTRKALASFLNDRKTIEELDIEDMLQTVKEKISRLKVES